MPRRKPKRPLPETVLLPLLPLKDAVVFPRMVVPLFVGRQASLGAVEESLKAGAPLFLCTQRDPEDEEPGENGLFRIGTAAKIINALRMPDGSMKIVVEGLGRGRVQRFTLDSIPWTALVEKIESVNPEGLEVEGQMRAVLHQFEEYVRLTQRIAPEVYLAIQGMQEPDVFSDTICAFLFVNMEERQDLLECLDVKKRLGKISVLLEREIELARIEHKVRGRVREQMERGQRAHYLQEQMKAIQQELGGKDDTVNEFAELREMIRAAKMPAEVAEKAEREMARYERLPFMSPESSVLRGYIESLCEMPWSKRTRDSINLTKARKVLDEDHFGLVKVKERILEFLAVRKLTSKAKGPILCLVGPPGVGKTSLGHSVARAMGRKFVRVSLGGVRDEAEIRGHRRTYVGALPGRIIQGMKTAGVKNPVFMLDEVDKMSMDFRGDPSSALLEVLDPSQNKNFSDHFLEIGFDLSEVFFITTANNEHEIPEPLHDRMEIVRLPGYTREEKSQIARNFLIPRQLRENGLEKVSIRFTDKALETILQRYTREAGVRELERFIAAALRKLAMRLVSGEKRRKFTVDEAEVFEFLGPPLFTGAQEDAVPDVGVAVGMAWTSTGGDTLRVETTIMSGKGNLLLTGQLGNVMRESAAAAHTYIRAHAAEFDIAAGFYKNMDMHVHVPEGAIPKDGPSAGVAMIVSMLSALLDRAPAPALSMTGEITLRGRVLPVGGIKEKVLAARRAGIKSIILPRDNEKDFPDLPGEVMKDISFHLVDRVDDVLKIAFPKGVAPPEKKGHIHGVREGVKGPVMKLSEVNFCLSAMQSGHFPKDGKPEVAFVGRSNVGKSSLLNTLFHRKELARTSSRPGKTQTINFFEVNKRCYFVNMPGYGFAKVPKDIKDAWNRLMHQYLTARGQLKLAVVLLDARHAPSANDQEMLDMLEESAVPTLVVATKSDKLSKNQLNASLALIRRELGLDKEAVVVPFSAVTGDGSRELWQIIGEVLA